MGASLHASAHASPHSPVIAAVDSGPAENDKLVSAAIRSPRERQGEHLRGICCREATSSSFGPEENPMKFMFTIYHDEKVLEAMPEKEMEALVDSAIEYAEEIQRSGHYIASNALQRPGTARTIRVREGKVSTTASAFAETKEKLGGFFVIEAKDIDEACAIAARFPPARVAVIEVRPVQELKHSRDRRGLPS
jgi:hypothetical protein